MLTNSFASKWNQSAQDSTRLLRRKAAPSVRLGFLALWLGTGALALAQPTNDNFNNATVVTGRSGSATGFNIGATKEFGEPDIAFNIGGASIWFSWQAPVSGTYTFDTLGSSFDTLLGVYTGSSVGGLTLVTSGDDIGFGIYESAVHFGAAAGTTYKIAVDGYDADEGSVMLSWVSNVEIVSSGPLTNITVGPDGCFQVYHSNFVNGQVYPAQWAPADAGFFVRQSDGTVNGMNIEIRPSAAQSTLATGFRSISQSLSQNGLEVTTIMDNQGDGTANHFQVTQVTRYRPGDEYFVVENTVLNQGASPFTADMFAAGDLYLADTDLGFGFVHVESKTVGGTDSSGLYHIFVQNQPGNPAQVLFHEDSYVKIWEIIGTSGSHFANTIRLTDYLDNGAGLEWPNVTVPPGASVKIAYTWAFGALSDLAVTMTALPSTVSVGSQITYQAVVTNLGSVMVQNVTLSDVLPSGVSFVSASSSAGSCQHQSGTIACNLGSLSSNQSALVTIHLQATAAGMLTNKVTVSGNQADFDLVNNTAVTQVAATGDVSPVLSIRSSGPNVVLSWQDTCASCVLKQVDALNPPMVWTSVGGVVTKIDGTNHVILPRGTNNRFFQLGPGP